MERGKEWHDVKEARRRWEERRTRDERGTEWDEKRRSSLSQVAYFRSPCPPVTSRLVSLCSTRLGSLRSRWTEWVSDGGAHERREEGTKKEPRETSGVSDMRDERDRRLVSDGGTEPTVRWRVSERPSISRLGSVRRVSVSRCSPSPLLSSHFTSLPSVVRSWDEERGA